MNIVKMKFGSHLYGLETENSDTDYKGIFLPSKEVCFLNKIPKTISESTGNNFSRNKKEDIDSDFFSLQYFIKMCLKGEIISLDMLHCPENNNCLIESSEIWKEIRRNRKRLYTKNLKSFFGYLRNQVSKYGVKGSRLNTCEEFISFFKKFDSDKKLKDIWDEIPNLKHSFKEEDMIEICSRKFQKTIKIDYCLTILEKIKENYGERAEQAKNNKNVDFKAVSHALRAGFQIKSIYEKGDIFFPFTGEEREILLKTKQGKLDFISEVSPLLESLVEKNLKLSEQSSYPEKPDPLFWEELILEAYK